MKKLIAGAALLFLSAERDRVLRRRRGAPSMTPRPTTAASIPSNSAWPRSAARADGAGRIFSKTLAAQNARPAGERPTRATDAPPFVLAVRQQIITAGAF